MILPQLTQEITCLREASGTALRLRGKAGFGPSGNANRVFRKQKVPLPPLHSQRPQHYSIALAGQPLFLSRSNATRLLIPCQRRAARSPPRLTHPSGCGLGPVPPPRQEPAAPGPDRDAGGSPRVTAPRRRVFLRTGTASAFFFF